MLKFLRCHTGIGLRMANFRLRLLSIPRRTGPQIHFTTAHVSWRRPDPFRVRPFQLVRCRASTCRASIPALAAAPLRPPKASASKLSWVCWKRPRTTLSTIRSPATWPPCCRHAIRSSSLHHANIDRIWASWNRQGGVNPTDTAWRNRTFANNFARANGSLYSIAVRNISDAEYLYDRYDPAPASAQVRVDVSPEAEWIQVATAGPLTGLLRDTTSTVRVANRNRATLFGRPATIPVGLQGCRRSGSREAVVQLISVASPTIANAPLVRMFVNHPAPCPNLPPEGPHYVGTFSSSARRRSVRRWRRSSRPRGSGSALRIYASPTPAMQMRKPRRASPSSCP